MPDYNFLSGPLWLITTLHVLTLVLHFVAMNFVVGGIIIALWGKFTNRWDHPVVRRFINLFPTAMAVTVSLGVAPLLFVQLVYHRQVYSAAIVSGWFWLMIVAAIIVSYYFLYATSFSSRASGSAKGWYLTLALVGLIYVSYIYSSTFSLAEAPDVMQSLYAAVQSGTALNPGLGEYFVRWLHMILGAVTVGGFFVGLIGKDNEDAFKVGKTFFLYGTIANAIVGFIYLFTLGDFILPLMRSWGIRFLTVGIIMALGTLHFYFKKRFVIAGSMLFVSLVTMVLSRHWVRLLRLEGHLDPSSIPIAPQWSVFALFLVCFVIALAVIWYMLKIFFEDRKRAT